MKLLLGKKEYSKKLIQELKKLISPFLKDQQDKFYITLEIKGLEHYLINDLKKTTIEPYPSYWIYVIIKL